MKSVLVGTFRKLKHPEVPGFEWSAVLDVAMCERPNEYMITRLFVPREHRRQGIATALLKEVLAEADRLRITLFVEARPTELVENISRRKLLVFFRRRGFNNVPGSPGLLRRRPRRDGGVT